MMRRGERTRTTESETMFRELLLKVTNTITGQFIAVFSDDQSDGRHLAEIIGH